MAKWIAFEEIGLRVSGDGQMYGAFDGTFEVEDGQITAIKLASRRHVNDRWIKGEHYLAMGSWIWLRLVESLKAEHSEDILEEFHANRRREQPDTPPIRIDGRVG